MTVYRLNVQGLDPRVRKVTARMEAVWKESSKRVVRKCTAAHTGRYRVRACLDPGLDLGHAADRPEL
jgi:hypothetical protein